MKFVNTLNRFRITMLYVQKNNIHEKLNTNKDIFNMESENRQKLSKGLEELTRLMDERIDLEENMDKVSRELLNELREIPNWECMIEGCKGHYEEHPNEFFDWCEIEYYPSLHSIEFVKGYSGGDEITVLSIDLDKPLEEQVQTKLAELQHKQDAMKKTREMAEFREYLRLKEKFGTDE